MRQLTLLPVALVPLAWTAADPDRARGAAVLAVAGLALGAAAELRFGDSEATFRLQLVMFAGALASLFAVAGLVADALARDGAEVETTRWRALVEASPVAVARVGRDGRWRPEGVAADDPDAARAAGDVLARAARVPSVAAAVAAGVPATVDWGVDDDTGRRFVTRVTPLPDGDTLAVTTETTRLHSAEVALAWERSHDRDTDLPNRDLLLATAEQTLAEGRAASLVLVDTDNAVRRAVLLDLDPVRVLLVTAERLRAELDPQAVAQGAAVVARVGDGQFGVLVPEAVGAARERAERMVRAVRAPLPGQASALPVVAWAGVAALDPERDARESLQRAEAALQAAAELQATDRGPGGVVVLDQLSVRTSAQRARLTGEVAQAVERGELDVAFQPDVCLRTGRLTGVEALVRWRRRRGFAAADRHVRAAGGGGRGGPGGRRVGDGGVAAGARGLAGAARRAGPGARAQRQRPLARPRSRGAPGAGLRAARGTAVGGAHRGHRDGADRRGPGLDGAGAGQGARVQGRARRLRHRLRDARPAAPAAGRRAQARPLVPAGVTEDEQARALVSLCSGWPTPSAWTSSPRASRPASSATSSSRSAAAAPRVTCGHGPRRRRHRGHARRRRHPRRPRAGAPSPDQGRRLTAPLPPIKESATIKDLDSLIVADSLISERSRAGQAGSSRRPASTASATRRPSAAPSTTACANIRSQARTPSASPPP